MAALGGGVSPVRVFWATPRATGYGNRRKRRRGLGRSLPRLGPGWGGRAGVPTTLTGGGGGVDLTVQMLGWPSGLLGTAIQHWRLLRSQSGGSARLYCTSGEKSRWRRGHTFE